MPFSDLPPPFSAPSNPFLRFRGLALDGFSLSGQDSEPVIQPVIFQALVLKIEPPPDDF